MQNVPYRTSMDREIAINPMGMYDLAEILSTSPTQLIAPVSNALYMGCVRSSCLYSKRYRVMCKKYPKSPFSKGLTQFHLRGKREACELDWESTCLMMMEGMANSMLTAQAPTSTTSMLVGVCESVTFPADVIYSRESANGRNKIIPYGYMGTIINYPTVKLHLDLSIDKQLEMYEKSALYVDHSQSTMFVMGLNAQDICNLIIKTHRAQLKTGIYYITALQQNQSIPTVMPSLTVDDVRDVYDDFHNACTFGANAKTIHPSKLAKFLDRNSVDGLSRYLEKMDCGGGACAL
jgi:hypothetical protein